MKIQVTLETKHAGGETLVRFVTIDRRAAAGAAISEAEFSGEIKSLVYLREKNELYLGLGDSKKYDGQTIRVAAGTAVRFLKKIGVRRALFDFAAEPKFVAVAAEGAILGDYKFEDYITKKTAPFEALRLSVGRAEVPSAKREIARAKIRAEAANFARNLGNQPGNVIFPETLADAARKLARAKKLRVEIFDERKLRAQKFGGLLAVGGGSVHPPRLIVLEHRGGPASEPPIVLIGKAITFDSGGISIKSADHMEEMVYDKMGGVGVLAAMGAIADLRLKRNVIGILPSAENLLSANSYRPGDLVRSFSGEYIEILNTDAEGRVVLADAIGYARLKKKPAAIIDVATLTGACVVALGDSAAGLWSSSESLKTALLAAAENSGERLWPMPSYADYDEQIRSEVGRVKNTGGRPGGACTAAAFLKLFAEPVPWAHLDIAGVAQLTKDRADLSQGATGFSVRTLIHLVENWQPSA